MIANLRSLLSTAALATLLPLAACGGDDATTTGQGPSGGPSGSSSGGAPAAAAAVPDAVFAAEAPAGAVSVTEALAAAEEGKELVVRAVIGGRKKAFVDSRAVLVGIDEGLAPCPPEEGCPTPWDYCCETPDTLLANTLTIQVVGDDGKPLTGTLKGVHGLEELKTIVVAGTVRTAGDTLLLDAKRIHVEG